MKGRENLEYIDVDEKIILKCILKERCENIMWLMISSSGGHCFYKGFYKGRAIQPLSASVIEF